MLVFATPLVFGAPVGGEAVRFTQRPFRFWISGVIPEIFAIKVESCQKSRWCRKKRMLGLSDGERILMIRSTIFDWSTRVTRVRTILVLGYWVLPNIFQYWVLGNTFIGCHTQYQYCLDTLIPVVSRWQQGNLGGGKVKLESWQIKELKMKFNKQWY